jgi:hypothetical protein
MPVFYEVTDISKTTFTCRICGNIIEIRAGVARCADCRAPRSGGTLGVKNG